MSKLLLAEREPETRHAMVDWLAREKHVVEVIMNTPELSEAIRVNHYDLVIIDLGFPDLNHVELCREYRCLGGMAPILLLSRGDSTEERIRGLDAGADDFLIKPFQMRELAATVRCLLRRPAVVLEEVLQINDLILDSSARSVRKNGRSIELHPMEFNLLEFLLRHPNQVFSAEILGARVWKSNTTSLLVDTVRTHIKTLRRKIDISGENSVITTVHGRGYKVEAT